MRTFEGTPIWNCFGGNKSFSHTTIFQVNIDSTRIAFRLISQRFSNRLVSSGYCYQFAKFCSFVSLSSRCLPAALGKSRSDSSRSPTSEQLPRRLKIAISDFTAVKICSKFSAHNGSWEKLDYGKKWVSRKFLASEIRYCGRDRCGPFRNLWPRHRPSQQ